MLTISSDQWGSLQAIALDAFEQRTAEHLMRYFPRRCRTVGRAALGQAIRFGLSRARHHHLESESCVRTYLECMCLLGSHFDVDPLLPWAAALLNDPASEADPIGRSEKLYERTWALVDRIAPDEQAWSAAGGHPLLIDGLQRLRDESPAAATPAELEGAARRAGQLLWSLFPGRLEQAGQAAVGSHLSRSVERASRLSLASPRGVALVSVLTFAAGPGFESDPFLPWIARALAPPVDRSSAGSPEDRLFAALVAELRRAMADSSAPARPA